MPLSVLTFGLQANQAVPMHGNELFVQLANKLTELTILRHSVDQFVVLKMINLILFSICLIKASYASIYKHLEQLFFKPKKTKHRASNSLYGILRDMLTEFIISGYQQVNRSLMGSVCV